MLWRAGRSSPPPVLPLPHRTFHCLSLSFPIAHGKRLAPDGDRSGALLVLPGEGLLRHWLSRPTSWAPPQSWWSSPLYLASPHLHLVCGLLCFSKSWVPPPHWWSHLPPQWVPPQFARCWQPVAAVLQTTCIVDHFEHDEGVFQCTQVHNICKCLVLGRSSPVGWLCHGSVVPSALLGPPCCAHVPYSPGWRHS